MDLYPFARLHVLDILCDLAGMDFAGRNDLICSALSIHLLKHDDKRRLYKKVFDALNPGGMFVNADQVPGESLAINRRYTAYWDDFFSALPALSRR